MVQGVVGFNRVTKKFEFQIKIRERRPQKEVKKTKVQAIEIISKSKKVVSQLETHQKEDFEKSRIGTRAVRLRHPLKVYTADQQHRKKTRKHG